MGEAKRRARKDENENETETKTTRPSPRAHDLVSASRCLYRAREARKSPLCDKIKLFFIIIARGVGGRGERGSGRVGWTHRQRARRDRRQRDRRPHDASSVVVQQQYERREQVEDEVVPEVPRPPHAHVVRVERDEVVKVQQLGPP
eukprot:31125-Pelagococcus_subviridis.AAC.16